MKKINLPVAVLLAAALLAAGALLWSSLQPAKQAPLPPPPSSVTREAVKALPKVITLYRKGEGESDLAVYVAKELAAKNRGLANFSNIDTSDEPQMLEFYGVNSVPTIIFIAPTGKVVRKHEGYLDQGAILQLLRSMK
jgi:thioredoxin-like negative regulator of GroEL